MSPALEVFVYTLPAWLIATVGGVFAAARPPAPVMTAVVQHLAAGIVFAATALELLPKERGEAAEPVVLGFALGIGLMLALRWWAGTIEKREEAQRLPTGLLAVTAFDLLIDGLVLGMAFAAGEKTGVLLTVALKLEVLFMVLSTGAAMSRAGVDRWTVSAAAFGMGGLLSIAAVMGRLLLGSLPKYSFAVLLGIGIVALLYLVTEELLVEAHEVPETPVAIAAFFLGFLAFLIIEMKLEGA